MPTTQAAKSVTKAIDVLSQTAEESEGTSLADSVILVKGYFLTWFLVT